MAWTLYSIYTESNKLASLSIAPSPRCAHSDYSINCIMPPTSFKKDLGLPPARYRTPSPPRLAFEPLSPKHGDDVAAHCAAQDKSNDYLQNGIKNPSDPFLSETQAFDCLQEAVRGKMETFVSIALATDRPHVAQADSPLTNHHPEPFFTGNSHDVERPSKRARSEKLSTPEWIRPVKTRETRPATSYEQSSDSRTFEAELLLNLLHEARFTSSWEASRQASILQKEEKIQTTMDNQEVSRPPNSCISHPHNKITQKSISPTSDKSCDGNTIMDTREFQQIPTSLISVCQTGNLGGKTSSDVTPSAAQRRGDKFEVLAFQPSNSEDMQETSTLKYQSSQGTVVGHIQAGTHLHDSPPEEQEGNDSFNTGLAPFANRREENKDLVSTNLRPHSQVSQTEERVKDSHRATKTSEDFSTLKNIGAIPSLLQNGEGAKREQSNGNNTIRFPSASATVHAICSLCHFSRNSSYVDSDNSSTSWISCDGCKSWFHFACAGFKSEREVRGVDKYRCRSCKAIHGSTTYVRKSSRAHSAIDYAGLHEGVLKTSDERLEHHYIKPIKEGTITFLPENFARMRPELVTADYFEKGNGMKEPIVVPASFNPQPKSLFRGNYNVTPQEGTDGQTSLLQDVSLPYEWLSYETEIQNVLNQGQDALDMVIPQNLTVRKVADLYGPEEKVEVIDVKSQNGEARKWNMRRWADYYESSNNKAVRNVISLEVSRSKLGRLIRRPQIVRDLDLQDSVWPQELRNKGEVPRVQLYCLMSIADCFTDFHIDFGGSSVFYHILKGRKTFLFIPPKEKHLKKYEEWCMSPAQNWTFLADQTKECYRVDLVQGDTMLIPAGWIHAVWTPEDSLVIGGNFLTRMHYGMQIRIAQIEKVTGVARKFRYPQFQKLHWYTALRYLEEDPLPESLKRKFREGGIFHRDLPAHYGFDQWGENSEPGLENYHARYYAQAELEGLPDLTRYLLRTALIDLGNITEGITAETRNAVKRAIPRGYGEPLDIVKDFAMWCAWKRGNEPIPRWAYPHAVLEGSASDSVGKSSFAALKKLDQEAALQAPRRQSARRQSQLQLSKKEVALDFSENLNRTFNDDNQRAADKTDSANVATSTALCMPSKRKIAGTVRHGAIEKALSEASNKHKRKLRVGMISYRKLACDSCRRRRRACKHRYQAGNLTSGDQATQSTGIAVEDSLEPTRNEPLKKAKVSLEGNQTNGGDDQSFIDEERGISKTFSRESSQSPSIHTVSGSLPVNDHHDHRQHAHQQSRDHLCLNDVKGRTLTTGLQLSSSETKKPSVPSEQFDLSLGNALHSRGRSKACNECRKSKVRILFICTQKSLLTKTLATVHT